MYRHISSCNSVNVFYKVIHNTKEHSECQGTKNVMRKPHIPIQTAPFKSCNTSVSNSFTEMFYGQFKSEEEEEEEEDEDEDDENHIPGVLHEEFFLHL